MLFVGTKIFQEVRILVRLVKEFIPLKYIRNIGYFGIQIPSSSLQAKSYQSKTAYTAQITRNTPTAFVFLIDQSGSMAELTTMGRNNQINKLVMRCIKTDETRHYFDIAVIAYGSSVDYAWKGTLEGKSFVTPKELQDNPYQKITVTEEKKTRKGIVMKEVEHVQWIEPVNSNLTPMHGAFSKAKELLSEWIENHKGTDCYPPTVINITDGVLTDGNEESMTQISNEIKSLFTNDGNALLFNVHISSNGDNNVQFPGSLSELPSADKYAQLLFNTSSLLPLRYNETIAKHRGDIDHSIRHKAMALNAGMSSLVQIMDIGTPTNINQNK